MAVRALIVAVENYPNASGLANVLPGTNDAAQTFFGWLTGPKKVDPKNVICCADKAAVPFATHGTTRPDILQAVQDLEAAGKDDTEELYCYFAGHGFCYPRDEVVQEDLFVASDFRTLRTGGGACLKLRELMDLLTPAMGPGDHYYFFDACRTEVKFGEIRPSDTGLTFDRSQLGFAGRAVLFSVEQGLAARVDSRFSAHLVDGLSGRGRAKGWHNDALYVKFEFLWKYVKAMMNRPVDQSIGQSEGLILAIDPVPSSTCTIRVEGASQGDSFSYIVRQRRLLVTQGVFQGTSAVVPIADPGDYQVELTQPSATIVRVKPPAASPVDLYDPAEVIFRKIGMGLESTSFESAFELDDGLFRVLGAPGLEPTSVEPGDGLLLVRGAPGAVIRVHEPQSSFTLGEEAVALDAGEYRIDLEEQGQVIASQTVTVGRTTEVDLVPPPSPLQAALLRHIAPQGGRSIEFSETLGGPTADRDTGLWLAWLGASRIIGREGEFSKLGKVPLPYRFSGLRPGSAPLYILAGFDGPPTEYAIGVGKDPEWADMTGVGDVTGLFEHFRDAGPGPKLVSFQARGRPPVTLSTVALADHATLLVLSAGAGPTPIALYQFLLPIGALMDRLPEKARRPFEQGPLKAVRFAVQVERLFAKEYSIGKALEAGDGPAGDPDAFFGRTYRGLVGSESLQPIASLIIANDLLRHGVLNPKSELHRQHGAALPRLIQTLREHLGAIPDVEALAKATSQPFEVPAAPPLLADSVASFRLDEQQMFMPFPNKLRHFGTPWVAWVNAVKPRFPLDV